ncbi:hypothetical protein [Synechococcus sp. BIOS-U3-1]|uniref:hypothetical protein n=1 Tax=Synechococcus sp. BIOS-U3-1 TaxID=1400865 RepID=UPI001647BF59|nr:hypothetical protein [Synechococcus sp. BIOS-U3-1]
MSSSAPRRHMQGRNRQLSTMCNRLRMLLSNHRSALNHSTLKTALTEVVIQQDTPAERFLDVLADDLLQAMIYDSDLVMEPLGLSSRPCRKPNQHLALFLEGLEALNSRESLTLEPCCQELGKESDQILAIPADRLRRLDQILNQR